MSYVKEIIIFFFAVFLPLSKSIIYSRYNTWIGQILSAWAPLLWQRLERGWKLWSGRNEFWGFEYVVGLIISGEDYNTVGNTDIKNLSHLGFKPRKNCSFKKKNKQSFQTHIGNIHRHKPSPCTCLTGSHISHRSPGVITVVACNGSVQVMEEQAEWDRQMANFLPIHWRPLILTHMVCTHMKQCRTLALIKSSAFSSKKDYTEQNL